MTVVTRTSRLRRCERRCRTRNTMLQYTFIEKRYFSHVKYMWFFLKGRAETLSSPLSTPTKAYMEQCCSLYTSSYKSLSSAALTTPTWTTISSSLKLHLTASSKPSPSPQPSLRSSSIGPNASPSLSFCCHLKDIQYLCTKNSKSVWSTLQSLWNMYAICIIYTGVQDVWVLEFYFDRPFL